MIISNNAKVILLLCSHLGLNSQPDQTPFKLKEWNRLVQKMVAADLQPGELPALTARQLTDLLVLDELESDRICTLLARETQINTALDQLDSAGIFTLTRANADYPEKYRMRLKDSAPTVLFYAGEKALLGQPGIAVVGSRHLDETSQSCAEFIGNACGLSGQVLYSGGAKGVDSISMLAALEARGTAVAVLAESLAMVARSASLRPALENGDLCLVSPYAPAAPFSVGAAMGRNRLIYTLADHAIVVASDEGKGGTWAGANEALKYKWLPVFALQHAHMPPGNQQLIYRGALPFPHPFQDHYLKLKDWLDDQAAHIKPDTVQPGLF